MVKANELDAADICRYDTTTYKIYRTNINSTQNYLSGIVNEFTENLTNLGKVYVHVSASFTNFYILNISKYSTYICGS